MNNESNQKILLIIHSSIRYENPKSDVLPISLMQMLLMSQTKITLIENLIKKCIDCNFIDSLVSISNSNTPLFINIKDLDISTVSTSNEIDAFSVLFGSEFHTGIDIIEIMQTWIEGSVIKIKEFYFKKLFYLLCINKKKIPFWIQHEFDKQTYVDEVKLPKEDEEDHDNMIDIDGLISPDEKKTLEEFIDYSEIEFDTIKTLITVIDFINIDIKFLDVTSNSENLKSLLKFILV